MSRCATAFVVAGVLVCLATPAYPCLNGTVLEGDQAVKAVVQLESALERGDYHQARDTIIYVDHFLNDRVVGRWNDAKMVFALRTDARNPRTVRRAIDYFQARAKQAPKSIKHRAWLAEAYGAARKRDKALKILVELRERDLMPDAFAWRALAVLSDGRDVDATLEICKRRAKNPSVCTIRQASRPVKRRTSNKMRL